MIQPLSDPIIQFITTHEFDNTDKLLLNAKRYPHIDLLFAVEQIEARRQVKDKLPHWIAYPDIIFPSRLSAEQCSSEITALYKQQLVKGRRVCDLTGGLGVDTWSLAGQAEEVIYIERSTDYCTAAAINFKILGKNNIRIINADSRDIITDLSTDTFYVDPARRSGCNKRLFALTDCEPDMLQLSPLLLQHSQRVLIKISPMADITETIRLLKNVCEVHIIAVKNECKEIIIVLDNTSEEPRIHAVNFDGNGNEQQFVFTAREEKNSAFHLADGIHNFLYEPHAALLKSGAFKLIASRYNVKKLSLHTHLYTSDEWIENFPGRRFQVEALHDCSGKKVKQLGKLIPQANITVRNFPMTVSEIRKNSSIAEGGNIYLFATTIGTDQRIYIQCRKNE